MAVGPAASASCGVPVTTTGALNVTVIGMTAPTPYVPLAAVELTPTTRGETTIWVTRVRHVVGLTANSWVVQKDVGLAGSGVVVLYRPHGSTAPPVWCYWVVAPARSWISDPKVIPAPG